MGSFHESISPFEEYSLDLIFSRIAIRLSEYEHQYEEEEPQRVFKIANTGVEFNFFKPRNLGSIYHRLIMDPNCVEELATSIIEKFEWDNKTATTDMIQLFADVAGIQSINIAECFENCDYKEILTRMRNNVPSNYEDSGYLLIKDDAWTRKIISILTKFVKVCVHKSEQRGNLFKHIFGAIFDFLNIFCKSKGQTFKHTGLFFVIHFCIAIGKVARGHSYVLSKFRDIADYNEHYRTQLESKIESCETELNICMQYTKHLSSIILRQCVVQYQGMHLFYEFYARSIPLLYLSGDDVVKKEYVTSLIFYLNYPMTDKITLIFIDSLTKMLQDERNTFNHPDGSALIQELFTLTFDNNPKIGANALKALYAATDRYLAFIPNELKSKLFLFMYNKNYVIAKEAGRFFMRIQREINNDIKGVLVDMVDYRICLPLYKNVPEDFVESIIDEAHELHQFEAIIKILLKGDDLEFEQEVALLEIFTHAVIIKITGTSYKPRVDSKKITYDTDEVVEVLNEILPGLRKLFEKYSMETDCLNNLMLIMKKIPHNNESLTQFHDKLYQIIKLYPKIFENTNDKNLLASISENLRQFSSELSPIQTLSSATTKCIIEKCLADYECDLNCSWNDNVQYHISRVLAKLAALRKFHPPIEGEIFMPLRQLYECGEEVLVNEMEYEANFLFQKVDEYLKNSRNESVMSLREMYDLFCEGVFQNLAVLKSMDSFTIALNSFVDILICFESVKNVPKTFSQNQIQIICLSIKKRLENRDDDSEKLMRKLLNHLSTLTKPIAFYLLALFNKLYNLYGYVFENMFASDFRVSVNKISGIITETILIEIMNLEKGRLTVCSNFTEIEELSIRFFTIIPKRAIPTVTSSWIELSTKKPSYFPFLELIENLCIERLITKDYWKFLSQRLQSIKFSSKKQNNKAAKLVEMLRNNLKDGKGAEDK